MTVEVHPDVKTLVDLSAKYAEEGQKEVADILLSAAWALNKVHKPARAA